MNQRVWFDVPINTLGPYRSFRKSLSSQSFALVLTIKREQPTKKKTHKMKKSTQRDANTARALAEVRFGHRPLSQTHRQDR